MSIDSWMNKEEVVHIYSGILFRKNEIMQYAATWMQLEIKRLLIKWSESEIERQIPYDVTYMRNLNYDTNEPIYCRDTESCTQRWDWWLPVSIWREMGEGWNGRLRLADVSFYMCACALSHFSCVLLFANLWTVAHQASVSMGFSR